jgi:TctA family transporter
VELRPSVLFRLQTVVNLVFLILLIYSITGLPGLLVGFAATGIGLIPVVFNSRRSNLMGVLLIPITLNMLGYGPIVAKWMGLV